MFATLLNYTIRFKGKKFNIVYLLVRIEFPRNVSPYTGIFVI